MHRPGRRAASGAAEDGGVSRPSSGRGIVRSGLIAVLVLALLAGGWGAALVFQSPAQVAAQAKAPPPGPVTAVVQRGDLSRAITAKAIVSREQHYDVPLLASESRAVVTRAVRSPGDALHEGDLVTEVNGRPRFALGGDFPFYRALAVGSSGPDVEQLQRALARAGHAIAVDGRFGRATAEAITRLYRTAGYEPPLQTASQSSPSEGTPGETTAKDGASTAAQAAPVLSVPFSDLLVFRSLPAFVAAAPTVGLVLTASTVVGVVAGRIVADADVDAATAREIRARMKVTLQGPIGEPVDGAVDSIDVAEAEAGAEADAPSGTQGASTGGESWTARFVFDADPPPDWLGKEVLASVIVRLVASDSLIVPTVAVVSGGDHDPHVLKRAAGGGFTRVDVKELGTLSGRSGVVPVADGMLKAGDIVKVD